MKLILSTFDFPNKVSGNFFAAAAGVPICWCREGITGCTFGIEVEDADEPAVRHKILDAYPGVWLVVLDEATDLPVIMQPKHGQA